MTKTRFSAAIFILVSIIAISISCSAAFAADGFYIHETSISRTGDSGSALSGTFTVENTGTTVLDMSFSDYVLTSTSAKTLTISPIGNMILQPNQTEVATFTINIPSNQDSGVYYGTLKATAGAAQDSIDMTATVNPTYKISVPSLIELTEDPGEVITGNIVVTKAGNRDITNLLITHNPSEFVDNDGDKINITFTPPTGINVTTSTSVGVRAMIPGKMDPGTYTGTLSFIGGGIATKTMQLKITVNNILQITDVEVSSEGDDDTFSPGEEMKFSIEISNIADELDLEDVEVNIYFKKGSSILEDDDGDDIEDDYQIGDLDAGDEETIDFTFNMPFDIDDGDDYSVIIEVEGENADDNSEKYTDFDDTETITAERESHKIEIYDLRFDSTTLSCIKSTYIHVGIRDIGSSNEDVELLIENPIVGLSISDFFEVDKDYDDDDFEVKRSHLIDLGDVPPGNYQIDVKAYYDDGDEMEAETETLTVAPCNLATNTGSTSTGNTGSNTGSTSTGSTGTNTGSNTGNIDMTVTKPTTSTGSAVTARPPTISSTSGSTFRDNTLYYIVLALANIIIIAAIVAVIVKLAGGKKEDF